MSFSVPSHLNPRSHSALNCRNPVYHHLFGMANQKQHLKPCSSGSFAFRRLWQHRIPTRKTMLKDNSKTKPRNNSSEKPIEFSLTRCSANQHAESDKDAACIHAHKTANGKLNTSSASAAMPIEFSLRRCSANQHAESDRKDTASSHVDKTWNIKPNTSSPSAAPRKMDDKDTSFDQLKKTVRGNLNCVPHVKGCISPYSRALVKKVQKKGVLRRALSPKAAMMVKRGMPAGLAVRAVGYQQAFSSRWLDGTTIYVSLKINRGQLNISRVPFG